MNRFLAFVIITLGPLFSFGQELSVQTGHSLSISKIKFSDDSKKIVSVSSDNSVILWDVVSGKQIRRFLGHEKAVKDVLLYSEKNLLISCSDDKTIIFWNIITGQQIKTYKHQSAIKCLSKYSESNFLFGAEALYSINLLEDNFIATLKTSFTNLPCISLDVNEQLDVAVASKELKKVYVFDSNFSKKHSFAKNCNSVEFQGKHNLIGSGVNGRFFKWHLNLPLAAYHSFSIPSRRLFESYSSSSSTEDYIALGNQNKRIEVYHVNNGKTKYILLGHKDKVTSVAFNNTGGYLATASSDRTIILWDMKTGTRAKTLQGIVSSISSMAIDNETNQLFTGHESGELKKIDLKLDGEVSTTHISPSKVQQLLGWKTRIVDVLYDQEQIFVQAELLKENLKKGIKTKPLNYIWHPRDNELEKLDIKIGTQEFYDFEGKFNTNTSCTIDSNIVKLSDNQSFIVNHSHKITDAVIWNDQTLITSGDDGVLKFTDLTTKKEMVEMVIVRDYDKLYVTPENYYLASKGALDGVGFTIEDKIYSFEQFDLIYNRPDKVVKALYPEDSITNSYLSQAYQKRLSRTNSSIRLTNLTDIPEIELDYTSIDAITTNETCYFKASALDAKDNLDHIEIVVNGVPEKYFTDVQGLKSWSGELQVKLSNGINNISVKAVNQNGIASLATSFTTKHKVKEKPNLYLISIGISKYEDDSYNLKYADKDALDLQERFKTNRNYENVFTKTLTNEEVTSENIAQLSNFVKNASVNDVVILFAAGHGILDKNLDFYFASYYTDFKNPSQNSIPYKSLENVLNETQSRKKVLLVDACHSGEIDKEEVIATTPDEIIQGEVAFRATGSAFENKDDISIFDLSKALFADLGNEHGAHSISSAGGVEFAIEGDEWQNGIFTYALLNGLKKKKADFNGDNKITVFELRKYIFQEVEILSQGQQIPTSRDENLEANFIVWE